MTTVSHVRALASAKASQARALPSAKAIRRRTSPVPADSEHLWRPDVDPTPPALDAQPLQLDLALTRTYFNRLGKELKPLLVQNGGPIIMTQVENEYGSYGSDHVYMAPVRDALVAAGFTNQLFTSDGPGQGMLNGGTLPGIPATVNFGGGAEGGNQVRSAVFS